MRGRCVTVAVACGLAFAGCARKASPPPTAVVRLTHAGGKVMASDVVTATAVVETVDQKSRMVTLRRDDGERIRFRASDEVKKLAQVKKGDHVSVSYYQSVALQLRKPGEAPLGVTVAEAAERAKPRELPAGAVAEVTTVTSTVVNVDRRKQTVTLELPSQRTLTLKVSDPARLERVKAGDTVEATYREAIAVAVERPDAP